MEQAGRGGGSGTIRGCIVRSSTAGATAMTRVFHVSADDERINVPRLSAGDAAALAALVGPVTGR